MFIECILGTVVCVCSDDGSRLQAIDSISFVGTKSYLEKIKSFRVDLGEARMLMFLDCSAGHFRHYAIVNDYYLFVDNDKFTISFEGIGVHGMTGEVRYRGFRAPGKFDESSALDDEDAWRVGWTGCYYKGLSFEDPLFLDSDAVEGIADEIRSTWQSMRLGQATPKRLGQLITEGPMDLRRNAAVEMISRGSAGVSELTSLLSSSNRSVKRCALHCLSMMNVDASAYSSALLSAARLESHRDCPICPFYFGEAMRRHSADSSLVAWQAVVGDVTLPEKERAYLLEVVGSTGNPAYLPTLVAIATDEHSLPSLAQSAVIAVNKLRADDSLVHILNGNNKAGRKWACYALGSRGSVPVRAIPAIVDIIANDSDTGICRAAIACIGNGLLDESQLAITSIARHLESADPKLRLTAIRSLGCSGAKARSVLPALDRLSVDGDVFTSEEARYAAKLIREHVAKIQ